MGVVAFDTYTAAKRLRAAGFNENQAEAAVAMVREAVAEGTGNTASLEAGLAELRTDVTDLKVEVAGIKANMARIEANMATKADVARIEADVAASKEASRALLRTMLALGAIMIVGFSAMLAMLAGMLS